MRDPEVVLSRRRRALVVLSLVAAFLVGCGRAKKADRPAARASQSALTTVALVGANAMMGASWTGDGDVLAWGGRHLFRLHPADATRVSRHFELEGVASVVAARYGETAAVLDHEGGLWSARGDALERVAESLGAAELQVSDDGFVFGVSTGDGYWFFDALRGEMRGHVATSGISTLRMAPSGRHTMDERGVFVTEGEPHAPAYRVHESAPVGWLGTRAIFTEPSALVFYEAERARVTRMPMPCDGNDDLDPLLGRVVRVCDDRVVFVSLEKLARTEVALQRLPGTTWHRWVPIYLRDSPAVVAYLTGGGPPARVAVDPEKRTVTDVSRGPIAVRTREGRPLSEYGPTPDDPFLGPHGERLFVRPAEITVENARRQIVAQLGADRGNWYMAPRQAFTTRAGGVEMNGFGNKMKPQVVRLGPPAAPSTEAPPLPAPDERRVDGDGHCPFFYVRRALADGRELRFAGALSASVCVCDGNKCEPHATTYPFDLVDATKDMFVQIARESPDSKVRLVDLRGSVSREATIPHVCSDGRVSLDSRTIALRCGFADDEVMVELDFSDLRVTRRTPIHLRGRQQLTAVGAQGFMFSTSDALRVDAVVLEAGTGAVRWSIGSTGDLLLARDARGVVDLPIGAAAPDNMLLCVDETTGSVLPLASCGPTFITHGAFRFE